MQWNVTFAHPLKHTVFQENLIFELIDLIVDFFAWIENKVRVLVFVSLINWRILQVLINNCNLYNEN